MKNNNNDEIYRITDEELEAWLQANYQYGWRTGFWTGSAISLIGMLIIFLINK